MTNTDGPTVAEWRHALDQITALNVEAGEQADTIKRLRGALREAVDWMGSIGPDAPPILFKRLRQDLEGE